MTARLACACALVVLTAGEALGQERIGFDRPEAWAMKYFTSATVLSGLSTPDTLPPGSIAIQFESGWLPPLSPA